MTLQIDLSPELEAKLRQRAAAAGKDAEAFAREAVEEKLRGRETLVEILGPIRKDFRDVPDAELEDRIQQAISEARSRPGKA
jgi:plasmid stability protein